MTVQPEEWARLDAEWIENAPSEPLERPLFRAPVGFGRQPGPRNHPPGKEHFFNQDARTSLGVTALTDRAMLEELLPPGVHLQGEPEFSVGVFHFENCFFLGGRDYRGLGVTIQVTSERSGTPLNGGYVPASWHSLPDNMLSARADLGWPTMWADIGAPIRRGGDAYSVDVSWLGFRFLEIEISDLVDDPSPPPAPPLVHITYKYVPKGYEEGPDVSYLVENKLEAYYESVGGIKGKEVPKVAPFTRRKGTGSFRFNPARWEDMPSQYNVINRLAELPILEIRRASVDIRTTAPM
jgi:hypothetical protein